MTTERPIGARETACFEAGIKFGSLYHQFAGTPIDPASAQTIARAMEASIENQPYCRNVSVTMDIDAIETLIDTTSASYIGLTGRLYTAEITIDYEGIEVVASMAVEDDYPRMRLQAIRE